MEYNFRKRVDVLGAIEDSMAQINDFHSEGNLNSESGVFKGWTEDHWIGIADAAENLENGISAEEGIQRAEAYFDNPLANRDIIAHSVAKFIYFRASDEVRAELLQLVPQEILEL